MSHSMDETRKIRQIRIKWWYIVPAYSNGKETRDYEKRTLCIKIIKFTYIFFVSPHVTKGVPRNWQ